MLFLIYICLTLSFFGNTSARIIERREPTAVEENLLQSNALLEHKVMELSERIKTLETADRKATCNSPGQNTPISSKRKMRNKTLETEMKEGNRFSVSRGKRATGNVAFTAYLDHELYHVNTGTSIIFNKMLLDDGGAYNHATGVFTCPVTGVYLLSFHIANFDAEKIVVRMVIDGANQIDAISESVESGQEIQGGNTVVLRLYKSQAVWVQTYEDSNVHIRSDGRFRYSTFSGILLY